MTDKYLKSTVTQSNYIYKNCVYINRVRPLKKVFRAQPCAERAQRADSGDIWLFENGQCLVVDFLISMRGGLQFFLQKR